MDSLGKATSQPELGNAAPSFDFSEASAIQDWMALLNDSDPSPLGQKVRKLISFDIDDPKMDFVLAEKLLNDPAHAKPILHLCNDLYLSPAETVLQMVPRAVILLGFSSVRNIALIVCLVEKILFYSNHPVICREIAKAFVTGLLAVLIAQRKVNLLNAEKVFTSVMINRIGLLLCLIFAGEKSKKLHHLIENAPDDIEAQTQLLGFSPYTLSEMLAQTWKLNDSLSARKRDFNISEVISIAEQAVESLYHGWESQHANIAFNQIKNYMNVNLTYVNCMCMEVMQRTLEVLVHFNQDTLVELVPLPYSKTSEQENAEQSQHELNQTGLAAFKANMTAIRNMGNLTHPKRSGMDMIMQKSIECMYQSLGFDRIVLALLTPDKDELKAKVVLEKKSTSLLEKFDFKVFSSEGWLFHHVLREQRPAWVGDKSERVLGRLRTTELDQKIGKGAFLVCPISIDGRAFGICYADRRISNTRLDIKTYDLFVECCAAMNEALQLQSGKPKA